MIINIVISVFIANVNFATSTNPLVSWNVKPYLFIDENNETMGIYPEILRKLTLYCPFVELELVPFRDFKNNYSKFTNIIQGNISSYLKDQNLSDEIYNSKQILVNGSYVEFKNAGDGRFNG